jgi:predicted NUDIX family NTP pyrophosphohydrolase
MAKKTSAGLLVYRRREELEVFLVHPGGPFWAKKDLGAWSLPKGEFVEGEDPLEAAKREFQEETGFSITGEFRVLNPLTQPSKKVIYAWAIEADCDPDRIKSNSSRWSGRQNPARCSSFQKLTAQPGLVCPRQGNGSSPAKSPLLTNSVRI